MRTAHLSGVSCLLRETRGLFFLVCFVRDTVGKTFSLTLKYQIKEMETQNNLNALRSLLLSGVELARDSLVI